MNSALFAPSKVQFLDDNGTPFAGGRLTFFEAETSILKSVYYDHLLVTPLPNPMLLDNGGFTPTSGIWLAEGAYGYKLERLVNQGSPTPIYEEVYTCQYIDGALASASGGATITYVDTITQLQNLAAGVTSYVYVGGYYDAFDHGGGFFKWSALSTASTDNGAIILPISAPAQGRWIRQFNGTQASIAMWGACSNTGTNCASRLQSASYFCEQNALSLVFDKSEVQAEGAFSVTSAKGNYIIESGFSIKPLTTSVTMTLAPATIEIRGQKSFLSGNSNILVNPSVSISLMPEWWGAVGDGSTDDSDAFAKMSSSAFKNSVTISKTYALNKVGPSQALIYFDNTTFVQSNGGMVWVKSDYSVLKIGNLEAKTQIVKMDTGIGSGVRIGGIVLEKWIMNDNIPSAAQMQQALQVVSLNSSSRLVISDDISFAAGTYTSSLCEMDIAEGVKITLNGNVTFNASVNIPSYLRIITNGYSWSNFPATAQFRWFENSDKAIEFAAKSSCVLTSNGNYTSPPTYIATGSASILTIRDAVFNYPVGEFTFGINHGGILHLDNVVTVNGSASSTTMITAVGGEMNNCKFYDNGGVNINMGGTNARVFGTNFNGNSSTTFLNPSNLWVSECYFAQDVNLQGTSTGYICIGTSIKKNTLGAGKNILAGAYLASLGHKADVYENATTSGSYVNSTKNTTQIQYTIAQNSVLVKSPDPTSTFYDAAVASKKFLPYQNAPLYASVEVARWSSAFVASDYTLILYYGMNDAETLKKAFFIGNTKTTSGYTTHFNFNCTWSSVSGDEI